MATPRPVGARLFIIALVAALVTSTLPASSTASGTPAFEPKTFGPKVFGPKKYTRVAGRPQTFTERFEHCGTAACRIVVINGKADGSKRISNASILLNGVKILGPGDFNQNVGRIVEPVGLADQNKLTITLASKPGSFLIVRVKCAKSPAVLFAGDVGVNLLNPTTFLSALPIINTGTAAAEDVEIAAITLDERKWKGQHAPWQHSRGQWQHPHNDSTLTSPASLPFDLGTIPEDEGRAILDADFSGGPFKPRGRYVLTVEGTYAVGDATYCFTLDRDLVVPPAAPGSATLEPVTVEGHQVSDAPFPPRPPDRHLEDVNEARWTVPIAPFVSGTPTPTGTEARVAPLQLGEGLTALANVAGPIVFQANNGLGITNGSTVAEPSGASSNGGVVFATSNWFAAYSTNGGGSFTQLDPTTIFPADAVGFCCDQIVQYVPSIDRFIWLLQGNGMRIASASPADIVNSGGRAWTYWNLTPGVFGALAGTGFDYPDLSVGDNYLYMSWNAGFPCPAGCNWGHQVARVSLAGLQAGGSILVEFTDPANGRMAWGAHLTQNTGNEIFWAGHNNNSNMRIFSLAEGSTTYFWRDRGIATWATGGFSSTTPDGQDWLSQCGGGFPGSAVLGGTRVSNLVWLAWGAGTDRNFQQAHVEMVALDRSNDFSVNQQVQIWNNSYAFAYPALATNACTGEVGLSFEYGGNGNYQDHVVGFWGDFVAYITTASNVGTCRFGDYVTLRQGPATSKDPGNLFTAFGYGLNSVPPPGAGTLTDIHHVVFGRPASSCIDIGID